MGASVASGGGRKSKYSGRFSGRNYGVVSEINVTPFVDVMLVLLIVFMVAAPMLTVGVPLDLPKTRAKAMPSTQNEPLSISVKKDGAVYIQKAEIALENLAEKLSILQAVRGESKETKLYLRADNDVNYGHVMKVMAELNIAGFKKVGLVTDRDE
ncbi:MAG: protein TolR [Pseudomonadota bacterium]